MDKRFFLGLLISIGFMVAACAPPASEEEIKDMCDNLVKVRGEVTVPDEAKGVEDIEEEFVKKRKHLTDWKAREMKSWDDELTEKVKTLKAEAEEAKGLKKPKPEELEESVKKLEDEYAKKKVIGSAKFDEDLKLLAPAEQDAVKALKKKIERKQEEIAQNAKECVESSLKEAISQKVAQCRINAQSPDEYWNICK